MYICWPSCLLVFELGCQFSRTQLAFCPALQLDKAFDILPQISALGTSLSEPTFAGERYWWCIGQGI